jgi:hypothetical protein
VNSRHDHPMAVLRKRMPECIHHLGGVAVRTLIFSSLGNDTHHLSALLSAESRIQ